MQVQDQELQETLSRLLQEKFEGDVDKMLQELILVYQGQLNRLKYSGILQWEKDGLDYQREIRREWG